jgi:hypothetical protein
MQAMIYRPEVKYDQRHDVLHVFLGSPINAFVDEEYPGIYINRNEDTDTIVGMTVMDFKIRKAFFLKLFPQYHALVKNIC